MGQMTQGVQVTLLDVFSLHLVTFQYSECVPDVLEGSCHNKAQEHHMKNLNTSLRMTVAAAVGVCGVGFGAAMPTASSAEQECAVRSFENNLLVYGGAVFTDDEAIAHRIASLRQHGKGAHKYQNDRIGMNSRLSS